MGSAGMVAAEFAPKLGVKVACVERDRVGGDCLWTGCVPSKALLASAKAAHTMRHADAYGLTPVDPQVDTAKVWSRIKAIQTRLAQTDDNPERFRTEGVDVLFGQARLTSATTVLVGEQEHTARFILLATGSRPATPPIEGLAEAGFLSSESIFELGRAPSSLIMIGAGPISIELAQAANRLGVQVTVLQRGDRVLTREEPELVDRLLAKLRAEGVEVQTGIEIDRVQARSTDGRKVVHSGQRLWAAEEIFVGAGRAPNTERLGLEEIGVNVDRRGVVVDDKLRTSVKTIYAAGDVAGRYLFTHSAGYEAARAIRNMFLPGSSGGEFLVPWCTFTDPELAHAGLTEAQAREQHGDGDVQVWCQDLSHSDRARAESTDDGELRIVTVKGRIVGAHALAPAAGELIGELALAIERKLKLTELASVVHVYPTISLAVQQIAGQASYARAEKYSWLVRSDA
jgi:pyruvate/2-oxoglutarate dehydrogenase complex dihydrolipoamide dehydrogenase (E3) component